MRSESQRERVDWWASADSESLWCEAISSRSRRRRSTYAAAIFLRHSTDRLINTTLTIRSNYSPHLPTKVPSPTSRRLSDRNWPGSPSGPKRVKKRRMEVKCQCQHLVNLLNVKIHFHPLISKYSHHHIKTLNHQQPIDKVPLGPLTFRFNNK